MANEYAGTNGRGFGARHFHDFGYQPGHGFYNQLHDAEVVKNGHQSGKENNRGQRMENEDKAEFIGLAHLPENHFGTGVGKTKQRDEGITHRIKNRIAIGGQQYEIGERNLKGHPGADQLPINPGFIIRKNPRNTNQYRQAKQTLQNIHVFLSPNRCSRVVQTRVSSKSPATCEPVI